MDNKQISDLDLLIETHAGLERQGPGSPEMTVKALGFIENLDGIAREVDFGCGTGGQTLALARHIKGNIIGVDQFSDFIDVLNANAKKQNLAEKDGIPIVKNWRCKS